jgi:hypothetical protein
MAAVFAPNTFTPATPPDEKDVLVAAVKPASVELARFKPVTFVFRDPYSVAVIFTHAPVAATL